ncbi:hypothetical protein LI205_28200 [bacterium MSK18_59]|nr:hypothetical protein [bacterium MSK18_59]
MIKTYVVERCEKYLKSYGVKIMSALFKDEDIRKESVGDLADSVSFFINRYAENNIKPEEAQSAGDTIKKELDGFVNNMNKFLM